MRAGGTDRKVTIEQPVRTQDSTNGSISTTWTPVLSRVWAEFEWLLPNRNEIVTHQVKLDRDQARLRLRWRDDIDSTMRVTLHGKSDRVFQIVGGPSEIPAEGRQRRIELYLESYTSAGDSP
jgi:SPP1 family predicted phage head-tail adaptor